jgi:hypothetical protein
MFASRLSVPRSRRRLRAEAMEWTHPHVNGITYCARMKVALANKNVRTVWALLGHGRDFKPDFVLVRAAA